MSELTRCNHCKINDMKRHAEKRGVELIVKREHQGEMRGWYSARFSDEAEPSAWFMQVTIGCEC
jgi:hypothetical protein